jgi:hypothetical protein
MSITLQLYHYIRRLISFDKICNPNPCYPERETKRLTYLYIIYMYHIFAYAWQDSIGIRH